MIGQYIGQLDYIFLFSLEDQQWYLYQYVNVDDLKKDSRIYININNYDLIKLDFFLVHVFF